MDKIDYYKQYNIPRSFSLANHIHSVIIEDVVYDDDNVSVYGIFSDAELLIRVARKIILSNGKTILLNEEQVKNTWYHELFHAFNYYYNTETNEALAQTFANFMREYEITKQ